MNGNGPLVQTVRSGGVRPWTAVGPFVFFKMNGPDCESGKYFECAQLEPLTTGPREDNHRTPEQLHTLRATWRLPSLDVTGRFRLISHTT